MNTKATKKGSAKITNTIEALRTVGKASTEQIGKQSKSASKASLKTLKKELAKVPQDFMDELFGPKLDTKTSAEFQTGESLETKDMLSDKSKENKNLKGQLTYERLLYKEETILIEKRSNELRIQLQAVMREVTSVAEQMNELASEVKIAAFQAPIEPGIYHVVFYTNFLNFLKNFRKKIESASVWLNAANGRAAKKNWLNNYKKHGAKYLLSGEHYISRSAG